MALQLRGLPFSDSHEGSFHKISFIVQMLQHQILHHLLLIYWLVVSNIFSNFTPIPGEMIQFDEYMFDRGWFNHQLEKSAASTSIYDIPKCSMYGIFTYMNGLNLWNLW